MEQNKVYGLMITGKDDYHLKLAINSAKSFLEQTYKNKELIVINDGGYTLKDHIESDIITEYKIEKGLNLGGLRNLSLDKVPEGEVWVQWDDDDFHHPQCVEYMCTSLKENNLEAVTLGRQVQFSFKKNSGWIVDKCFGYGIEGTIMSRKHSQIRYPNGKKGEDTVFIKECVEVIGEKLRVLDNPPHMYLRFIHGYNTWGEDHFRLDEKPQGVFNGREVEKDYLVEVLQKYYV